MSQAQYLSVVYPHTGADPDGLCWDGGEEGAIFEGAAAGM